MRPASSSVDRREEEEDGAIVDVASESDSEVDVGDEVEVGADSLRVLLKVEEGDITDVADEDGTMLDSTPEDVVVDWSPALLEGVALEGSTKTVVVVVVVAPGALVRVTMTVWVTVVIKSASAGTVTVSMTSMVVVEGAGS